MRTVPFDFPYFHPELGEQVVVEVEAMVYGRSPNPESDWDAQDFIELVEVNVYLNGERISVDIPDLVVYSEISLQIRKAQIDRAFLEEDGGF